MSLVQAPDLLNFEGHEIRAEFQDDHVWFVAKDVCKALGIDWSGKTLRQIKTGWRSLGSFPTESGMRSMTTILEPAVYKLAFRSNKPQAERLTDWLASEVMPSIRKTGTYGVTEEAIRLFQEPLPDAPPPEPSLPESTFNASFDLTAGTVTLPIADFQTLVNANRVLEQLGGPSPKPRGLPHNIAAEHDFAGKTEGMHGWYTTRAVADAVGCTQGCVHKRTKRGTLPKGWAFRLDGNKTLVFIP